MSSSDHARNADTLTWEAVDWVQGVCSRMMHMTVSRICMCHSAELVFSEMYKKCNGSVDSLIEKELGYEIANCSLPASKKNKGKKNIPVLFFHRS